jgi:TRAP-type uncharacterized transport system fused permease subunit
MMQAWKYSLPAFLVPFLFSASPTGANLLILGANLPGFILALLNSVAALFFLSLGIVGYLRTGIPVVERALLVAVACVMVLFPVGPSALSVGTAAVGVAVVAWNLRASRRPDSRKPVRI